MADNDKQTAEQKRELKKNERSKERAKERADLSDQQMDEIAQLLKTRKEEDQAEREAEQDRSDERQREDGELAQQDQQNEQEAHRQLNDLKNKFIERAIERADQIEEDGARRRAEAKYIQRANKLAEEADRFYRQIIGWRSGLAKKIYNESILAEHTFDDENHNYKNTVRGFEDEETTDKHNTETGHLLNKYNHEDLLDEADYRLDAAQDEIDNQKEEAQKKAEKEKAEAEKAFTDSQTNASGSGSSGRSHTNMGKGAQNSQAAAAAAAQKQQQDKLAEIDKRLASTIKDLDDKAKGLKVILKGEQDGADKDFEKSEQKIDQAHGKFEHDMNQRRYEAKRDHLEKIKNNKEQLKLKKKQIVEEYKAKLKTIYEARKRKPSSRPYRTDDLSAQEGTPQQTYLEIVNQYETPDKPLSQALRNVEATHAYIKKLVGRVPWLERCGVGEVLSVNRNSHRCTVRLGSSPSYDTIENCTTTTVPVTTTHTVTTTQPVKDANGNVTGFENVDEEVTTTVNLQETICTPDFTLNDQGHVILSDVRYGSTHPKKGESYTVHIPAVYRDAKTHYDAGRPWIIVPEQSKRFLYRKWGGRGETIMERWDWPPPAVDQPWLPERVHDNLSEQDSLLGAVTVDDGGNDDGTQIVLRHTIPASEAVEGSNGLEILRSHDVATQYPGMGFDDPKEPWTPSPTSISLLACANDSVTTVGQNWNDMYIVDPESVTTGLSRYTVETILCCLPFPFQVIDPFTGLDVTPPGVFCAGNYVYSPVMGTITAEPLKTFAVANVMVHKGKLAQISGDLGSYQNQFQVIHGDDYTTTGVINNVACGGCHWWYATIFPINVFWDYCSPNPTYYTSTFVARRVTIFKDWFAMQRSFRIGGAWGDKAAAVISERRMTKVAKDWNDWQPRDQRLWLYGTFGVQDVTLPGFTEYTDSFDITAMAMQTDENGNDSLVMIGDLQRYTGGPGIRIAHRWQNGTWTPLNGVQFVWDMSQDGMDMVGSDQNGGQVYSLDSGKTWQPCPKLLPKKNIWFPNAVKFIDDFS